MIPAIPLLLLAEEDLLFCSWFLPIPCHLDENLLLPSYFFWTAVMQIPKGSDGNKKQTYKTKQFSDWVKKKSSQGILKMRSMGATAVCETRTDKDWRANAVDLYFHCGILVEIEVVMFNYLEITFWFLSFSLTMVHSETRPHGSWLYNYYPS